VKLYRIKPLFSNPLREGEKKYKMIKKKLQNLQKKLDFSFSALYTCKVASRVEGPVDCLYLNIFGKIRGLEHRRKKDLKVKGETNEKRKNKKKIKFEQRDGRPPRKR